MWPLPHQCVLPKPSLSRLSCGKSMKYWCHIRLMSYGNNWPWGQCTSKELVPLWCWLPLPFPSTRTNNKIVLGSISYVLTMELKDAWYDDNHVLISWLSWITTDASNRYTSKINEEVICCQLELENNLLMTTEAFSRNLDKLFSQFNLVTNDLFIYAEAKPPICWFLLATHMNFLLSPLFLFSHTNNVWTG